MKLFIATLICLLISSQAMNALERDIQKYNPEYQSYFCHDCLKFFGFFGAKKLWNDIDVFIKLIPTSEGKCCERCCGLLKKIKDGVYAPYLSRNTDYFEFLKDHLQYCAENTDCQCYWPELCHEAGEISDQAYELFLDLFINTELSILVSDQNEQKFFLQSRPWNAVQFSEKGVVIALISKAFFYSDYYKICEDLEQYSSSKFNESDYSIITEKLENIKEILGLKYLKLYDSCISKHRNNRIVLEQIFLSQVLYPIESSFSFDIENITTQYSNSVPPNQQIHFYSYNTSYNSNEFESFTDEILDNEIIVEKDFQLKEFSNQIGMSTIPKMEQRNWLSSQILLNKGSILNELLLYNEAIKILTESIQLNPQNHNAYIERAMAFFETDQLALALKDYEMAKKLMKSPPFKLESHTAILLVNSIDLNIKIEFSKGLIAGTLEGAKTSTIEFVPSTLSCFRGILNGLWAFACSPSEISIEMINAAYEMGEFINKNGVKCFECVVPELSELSLNWNKADHYSKGHKIGYIIGKYGIDIFAPGTTLKAVSKLRALRRANIMCTLESCAASQVKQAKVLEEAVKHQAKRASIINEASKKGKILTKNYNSQCHIMNAKHGWDKLVKITGSVEKDCKTVIKLLEDNQIFLEKYNIKTTTPYKNIIRYDHEMKINGYEIRAVFNKSLETGEIFLNDAWVITK